MRLSAEDKFHVAQLEAEAPDILLDLWHRLRRGPVDKEQPSAGVDQSDSEAAETDKIGVAEDARWRLRRQPLARMVRCDRAQKRIVRGLRRSRRFKDRKSTRLNSSH